MNRIRTGDNVKVIAGKSKGTVGKVLKVNGERVIVEGANMIKKHVKPNPHINQEGGIISKEASIHISNIALYNSNTQKADKVGFRTLEKDGRSIKVRYFKSNNEYVDAV